MKLTIFLFYACLIVAVTAQSVHYALRDWWNPIIPGVALGFIWGLAAWKNRRSLNTLLFLCMVVWNSLGLTGNENLLLPILSGTCIVAAWNTFDFLSRLRQYGGETGNTQVAKKHALRLASVSGVAIILGGFIALFQVQIKFEFVMLLVFLGFIGLSQLVRYLLRSRNSV